VTFLVIGADVIRFERSFVEINIVQFTYGTELGHEIGVGLELDVKSRVSMAVNVVLY
jgi:hypothetical protein